MSRTSQYPPHLENDLREVELSFSGEDIIKVMNTYSAIHSFLFHKIIYIYDV